VRDPVHVVWQRLFNRHLNVPREHTRLIELQTLIELEVRVSSYETLNKFLTESVSSRLFEWIESQTCTSDAIHCVWKINKYTENCVQTYEVVYRYIYIHVQRSRTFMRSLLCVCVCVCKRCFFKKQTRQKKSWPKKYKNNALLTGNSVGMSRSPVVTGVTSLIGYPIVSNCLITID
jgi:hypothetical protein